MLKSSPAGSHPDIAYTHQRLGPVRVVRSVMQPGQWVETLLPACAGYYQIDNISVQTRGTTVDLEGRMKPRHPGWHSRLDNDPVDEERVVRRTAIDEVEQWCLRTIDPDKSLAAAEVVPFRPGGYGSLLQGWEMLILDGSVVIDEKSYNTGSHIVARSRTLSLEFEAPGILVFWPSVL